MQNDRPLFTVVTVVFNDVRKIEKTLKSVLAQSFPDYEYIVVDGGSTDGTLDVIERYRDRIDRLIAEPDRGIYDAMNKGIEEARGEWINFMNSGDTFADEHVLVRLSEAARSERWDVLYGDVAVRKEDGSLAVRKASPAPRNIHRMFCCHQSSFVRTKRMKENRFDLNHPFSADLKFFKQCCVSGFRFFYTGNPLSVFDTEGITSVHRVSGLLDNVRVVRELDRGFPRFRHLMHLYYAIGYRNLLQRWRGTDRNPADPRQETEVSAPYSMETADVMES